MELREGSFPSQGSISLNHLKSIFMETRFKILTLLAAYSKLNWWDELGTLADLIENEHPEAENMLELLEMTAIYKLEAPNVNLNLN